MVVISGFSYSTYYDEKEDTNFMLLNELENKFDTKNYSSFSRYNTNIQIIKNKETIENVTVSKYQFDNDDIKIFKYEK